MTSSKGKLGTAHVIVLKWVNTVKLNENEAEKREAQLEIYPQEVV